MSKVHKGRFHVRTGGDKKQKINFAPNALSRKVAMLCDKNEYNNN